MRTPWNEDGSTTTDPSSLVVIAKLAEVPDKSTCLPPSSNERAHAHFGSLPKATASFELAMATASSRRPRGSPSGSDGFPKSPAHRGSCP